MVKLKTRHKLKTARVLLEVELPVNTELQIYDLQIF